MDQIIEKNKTIEDDSEEEIIQRNTGIQEENIFFNTLFNIPIELNIINDISLAEGESSKIYLKYNIDDDTSSQILLKRFSFGLKKILKGFISLTKSGNKLAYDLNKELETISSLIVDLINDFSEQITLILPKEDLIDFFDYNLAIKQIDSLPYNFIFIIDDIIKLMDDLNNNIPILLNNTIITLNKNIKEFLLESHKYLDKILNYIIDISKKLNSYQSKIYYTSSYYLNEKRDYYYNIIKSYNNILHDYYIKEKEIIFPLIDTVLNNFYENTNEN